MTRGRDRSGGGGLSIASRFSLLMTFALLVVMAAAGYFLLDKSRRALDQSNRHLLNEIARRTVAEDVARGEEVEALLRGLADGLEGLDPDEVYARLYRPSEGTYRARETAIESGRLHLQRVTFIGDGDPGFLAQYDGRGGVLAPAEPSAAQEESLFGLILMVTAALVAVGAGVAFGVSTQVTKPIEQLVDDVRSISRGNLRHRTRVKGGGEVYHLARQIDRMAQSLEEAQEAEIELGVREREREVAQEVREALLPESCPVLEGYEVVDLHVDAAEPGGDFHDFVEVPGKVIMLVCEVSGQGVPGALVGATARAYLKTELARADGLQTALQQVNRDVARDVRRGMYVTAMCLVLDPLAHEATMACAGHKFPLIRFEANSGKLRLVQPEGIALGFDKGPIFDRSLTLLRVPLEPGDRLVLANTGPVQVVNEEGSELGEKAFYRIIAKNASETPEDMLNGILTALETFAGEADFPADISLVILARSA